MESTHRRNKRRSTRTGQSGRVRAYINEAKSHGCQLCGYKKCLSAIEFHHVGDDKGFELSSAGSRSLVQVCKEIAKCVIICANCHREIHENDLGFVNKGLPKVDDKQNVLPFCGTYGKK